ncbi:MAG: DoxX family protein [Nanoarchaeota archaeon]|nr:DoxX family protein [Nanoarchaeota archaeon]
MLRASNFKKHITPELALRIGLGGVFLYAGINSLLNPTAWIGFIPQWINNIPLFPELVEGIQFREIVLMLHGAFEIVLALALLLGFWKRLASLLAFLSIAGMLIFYGVDDVSFRDFGLLAMAYALLLLTKVHIDKKN